MLEEHSALLGGFIANGIDLGLEQAMSNGDNTFSDVNRSDLVSATLLRGLDLHFQIQRVRNQTLLFWLQVFDSRITGISGPVENRDRALHEVQPRRVGQSEAVERKLAP